MCDIVIWRAHGLDRMAQDGMGIGILNDKYCKLDPEKENHDPEKSYWHEANDVKLP